jgi:DTW domain-containing protein YfiP
MALPRCPRCGAAHCFCERIPRIATRTRFVLLRHAWELDKASNSGRIAHLALENSIVHDIGIAGQPFDPAWIPDGAWLLFPAAPPEPLSAPSSVVVLDGTWAQAKQMLKRNPALWRLPRLGLPRAPDRPRLRTPPEGGMSTLEAIAEAVALLEDAAKARALHELYDVQWRAVSALPS